MVNTFLVHPDYTINAKLLNSQRLNKQITEATQIYNICRKIMSYMTERPEDIWELYDQARQITREHKIGWGNHPAVLMWLGYEDSLCEYIAACYNEWTTNRRRKNGTLCQYKNKPPLPKSVPIKPWWVYGTTLMLSHRVMLLNKEITRGEPDWYKNLKLFRDIPVKTLEHYAEYGYIWPSKLEQ